MRSTRDTGRESRHVTSNFSSTSRPTMRRLCKKKDLSKYMYSHLTACLFSMPFLKSLLCRSDVMQWGIIKLICYIPNCTNTDIKAKSIDNTIFPSGNEELTMYNVPICSYHTCNGTGMHTQHIVTAKYFVENISVTTVSQINTNTDRVYRYNCTNLLPKNPHQ